MNRWHMDDEPHTQRFIFCAGSQHGYFSEKGTSNKRGEVSCIHLNHIGLWRGSRHTNGMFISVSKVQKFVFPRGLATQNGDRVYTMVQDDEFSCFILGNFFECCSNSQTAKQKANQGFHTVVIDQYFSNRLKHLHGLYSYKHSRNLSPPKRRPPLKCTSVEFLNGSPNLAR